MECKSCKRDCYKDATQPKGTIDYFCKPCSAVEKVRLHVNNYGFHALNTEDVIRAIDTLIMQRNYARQGEQQALEGLQNIFGVSA